MNLHEWSKENFPNAKIVYKHDFSVVINQGDISIFLSKRDYVYYCSIYYKDSDMSKRMSGDTPEKAIENGVNFHEKYLEDSLKVVEIASKALKAIKKEIKLGESDEV